MKELYLSSSACLLMLLAATPSIAQSEEQQPAASDGGLTDIIVTAQRRAERLQDVPIAVNAFSSEQLAASSIQSTMDLAIVTPGLYIGNASGYVRPTIRGIGTAAAGPGIENSVATYTDGVYLVSQPAALISLTDIERVEVLKGPQGTLFGRNATGGLINIITKDPGRDFNGSFHAGYGNYKTVRLDGYVAGPISDTLGASLAATYTRQGDGYGHNLLTGRDFQLVQPEFAVRGKLVWSPGDATKVKLSADFSQVKGTSFIGVPIRGAQRSFFPPRAGGEWDADGEIFPYRNVKAGGATLNITHEFGDVTLTSISAYRESKFVQLLDTDNSPAALLSSFRNQIDRQFSQEFQLSGGSSSFNWVTGAYYLNSVTKGDPLDVRRAGAFGNGRTLTFARMEGKSASLFAQGTLEIMPMTHFTVGARITDETRNLSASEYFYTGTGNLADPGVLIRPNYEGLQKQLDNKPLTWRLALDHRFSEDILGYISYNRGFKSGGFGLQNPSQKGFRPERLDAYEFGIKSEFLQNRLRFNVAGFLYNYKDMQVFTIEAGTAQTYNGARSRLYGVDVDMELKASSRLTLSGGLNLLHHRFLDFPLALLSAPLPSGGYSQVPGSAKGNKIPNAADVTGNLSADYTMPVGDNEIGFNVAYQYSSGFYGEPDNRLRQSAYHIINASVEFRSADDLWTVRLWGKNLADEAVATSLATAPFASFVVLNPPRTYGVTLGMNF